MEQVKKSNSNVAELIALFKLLWSKRKLIIITCFISGVLSVIVAFSIPKEFTARVIIAPEMSADGGIAGGLGALASMAGISMDTEEEAIYPQLYPQIVSSTPFLCDLVVIPVKGKFNKNDISTNLYNYLTEYQREPWWNKIVSAPFKLIKKEKKELLEEGVPLEPKRLNREQQELLKALSDRIFIDFDKLSSAIYVNVTMQDAEIASAVADAVTDKLQNYVVNYRTAKARKEMENTQLMYDEARDNYFTAQRAYAEYCDQHMGVTKLQYLIEQDRLSDEKDLAYTLYNQLAQQLDMSKTKLLEKTPVVVILQPSTVPYKATSPKKMMLGIIFLFLAFFGTCAWVLIKEHILNH